jgi:K(+)-stimulated pyrophosphate-energized sodium pump
MAFLKQEYKMLSIFVLAVMIFIVIANLAVKQSPLTALAFLYGALSSGLAGFFGMKMAVGANVRTSNAAIKSLPYALRVAFSGGLVMGLCVTGLGIMGLGLLFAFFKDVSNPMSIISGFGFGASSVALFARVGGGIYTKAADVGADLVGKVEAGIPEDDPRNPAVIADQVGDNVGDVAGMGADLFESFVCCTIAAMVIGSFIGFEGLLFPLLLISWGVVSVIIATFFVKIKEEGDPQAALNKGLYTSSLIMALGAYFISVKFLPNTFTLNGIEYSNLGAFYAVLLGILVGAFIGIITEYFTGIGKAPSKGIAQASQTGAATTIIHGLAVGMKSAFFPVLIIAVAVILSYKACGLFGISLAGLGVMATTAILLGVDAYGPIADNAGGISEMANLPKEVRARTDKLDAVGNTTAAIGKGSAIASAALTALSLFSAFSKSANLETLNILNPFVVAGIFIGAALPFLFASMTIFAVGKAAFGMIEEVRRQFREIKGLLDGSAKADYARCVSISTQAAIRRMILPGLMAVAFPFVVGFISIEMLGGLLAGSMASGLLLAMFMANSGGAWDNAKKFIEEGNLGGKGSDTHKAAVIGDTVGDPFKDTAGPSMNILIKLMSVISLVFVPLFLAIQR